MLGCGRYKLYGKNGKTCFQSEAVCSQLLLLKILFDIVIYSHHGQILNPATSDTKFRNLYLSHSAVLLDPSQRSTKPTQCPRLCERFPQMGKSSGRRKTMRRWVCCKWMFCWHTQAGHQNPEVNLGLPLEML